MNVADYVDLLLVTERELAGALAGLAERHAVEPDVGTSGMLLASWSDEHTRILAAHTGRPLSGTGAPPGISRAGSHARSVDAGGRAGDGEGPVAGRDDADLLLDLQDAWRLAQEVHLLWWVLGQAARVLRDRTLASTCAELGDETDRQIAWLRTRIEAIAPQVLIAGP